MARYDVFNGDADGICALLQLRLAAPADSTLITGVKRDIDLLKQVVAAPGDEITVLDVSMDTNRAALDAALAAGAKVTYVDHHFPGEIPQHGNLTAHINTDASCCTSLGASPKLAPSSSYREDSPQKLATARMAISARGYPGRIASPEAANAGMPGPSSVRLTNAPSPPRRRTAARSVPPATAAWCDWAAIVSAESHACRLRALSTNAHETTQASARNDMLFPSVGVLGATMVPVPVEERSSCIEYRYR